MTKRATFTQVELVRAIRAAAATGKVAVQTRDGIAFVEPDAIPHDHPDQPEVSQCDKLFGVSE